MASVSRAVPLWPLCPGLYKVELDLISKTLSTCKFEWVVLIEKPVIAAIVIECLLYSGHCGECFIASEHARGRIGWCCVYLHFAQEERGTER